MLGVERIETKRVTLHGKEPNFINKLYEQFAFNEILKQKGNTVANFMLRIHASSHERSIYKSR